MNNLIGQMDEILVSAPEQRHSYFQLKYFVINKEPTHQAKLWQCLRELQSRREAIESINFEIEEANDNLLLLDIQGKTIHYPILSGEEQEIHKRQLDRKKVISKKNIEKLEKRLNFLAQEARYFLECYKELSKIEAVKDYDDLEAQSEYQNEKLSQEVTLRTLLQVPLDAELAKSILALPDDMPIKVRLINSLKHIQNQLADVQSKYIEKIKEKNVKKEIVQH